MGPSSKAKRYPMSSGTRKHWAENLEKQFPTEKAAIAKLMKLLDVSIEFVFMSKRSLLSSLKERFSMNG